MALRTRIAVTFLLLLAVVLTAALGAVSIANQNSAKSEVTRQLAVGTSVFSRLLESNRRQLTQGAQAVAADYGFREAVAAHDTDTLASVLENSGARAGAALVVLTTLDGEVIASSGAHVEAGSSFPIEAIQKSADSARPGSSAASLLVDNGHIYQMVTVAVRSPVPVAWIAMGFALDDAAARSLADITGLGVALAVKTNGNWKTVVNTSSNGAAGAAEVLTRRIEMGHVGDVEVIAVLSRSLAEASAPFKRLSRVLLIIAAISLAAFALAAFWLARNITRPLKDLTQAVNQMRSGKYDMMWPARRRNDELGMLADGLRLMQTAVKSRDSSIRRLAYEDGLTGLMNRTAFGAALSKALQDAGGATLGVALINLHRFRRINEHLGYSVGDAVLIKIAERLSAVVSDQVSVARLAADQFAAYARLRAPTDMPAWGASLLAALSEPVCVEAQPIDIAATVGLAFAVDKTMSADELTRCAELALEKARREKRSLALYERSAKPQAFDQLSLLGELRRAVDQSEFRLYFQPKLEMLSNRVAGAEVLLRWQHPTRGLLSPAQFIPFAEQTGFIRLITRWTLEQAIAQGAAWQRAGRALNLAVNISAHDIGDASLDARVAALLTRHELSPALLTLEVTESGFIENPNQALQMLNAIAVLGVKLSIDDFGTGYSSLSHLARMPVHEVKIDRSFIQGMDGDSEFATVVRSAIEMGHALDLKVVAEGIETQAAATRLREFGCDVAQGYLYAKPMPCAALELWLADKQCVPMIAAPTTPRSSHVGSNGNLATV